MCHCYHIIHSGGNLTAKVTYTSSSEIRKIPVQQKTFPQLYSAIVKSVKRMSRDEIDIEYLDVMGTWIPLNNDAEWEHAKKEYLSKNLNLMKIRVNIEEGTLKRRCSIEIDERLMTIHLSSIEQLQLKGGDERSRNRAVSL